MDILLKNGKYGVTELRLPVNLENKVQDIKWGALTTLENGMFVKVDAKTGTMTDGALTDDVYLVNSVVKNYEGRLASSDYINKAEAFLPRLQRFGKGSIIATDNVVVDDAKIASFAALATYLAVEANKAYAYIDVATKRFRVCKAADAPATIPAVYFEVKSVTTLKTGEAGVELERI